MLITSERELVETPEEDEHPFNGGGRLSANAHAGLSPLTHEDWRQSWLKSGGSK